MNYLEVDKKNDALDHAYFMISNVYVHMHPFFSLQGLMLLLIVVANCCVPTQGRKQFVVTSHSSGGISEPVCFL